MLNELLYEKCSKQVEEKIESKSISLMINKFL